jgi:hypothetical protein
MKKSNLIIKILIPLFIVAGATLAFAADKVDLTGTWKLAVTTPNGTGNPIFVLKQAGNKLTGTYEGKFGKSPVTGSVTGKTFEIKYTMDKVPITYKGKVEGTKISGTVEFGDKDKGTFTGEKG